MSIPDKEAFRGAIRSALADASVILADVIASKNLSYKGLEVDAWKVSYAQSLFKGYFLIPSVFDRFDSEVEADLAERFPDYPKPSINFNRFDVAAESVSWQIGRISGIFSDERIDRNYDNYRSALAAGDGEAAFYIFENFWRYALYEMNTLANTLSIRLPFPELPVPVPASGTRVVHTPIGERIVADVDLEGMMLGQITVAQLRKILRDEQK